MQNGKHAKIYITHGVVGKHKIENEFSLPAPIKESEGVGRVAEKIK